MVVGCLNALQNVDAGAHRTLESGKVFSQRSRSPHELTVGRWALDFIIRVLRLADWEGHWLSNPKKIYFFNPDLAGISRNWPERIGGQPVEVSGLITAAAPVLARFHSVCPPSGLVIARVSNVERIDGPGFA